jgi:hypothetical protein
MYVIIYSLKIYNLSHLYIFYNVFIQNIITNQYKNKNTCHYTDKR